MRIARFPGPSGSTDVSFGVVEGVVVPDTATLLAVMFAIDAGSVIDISHVVNDALVLGGNEALRGPKPYVLLTPDQIASGGSVASVHAARDAAPVGGVVRITAPVSGTVVNNKGQKWQWVSGLGHSGLIQIPSNNGALIQGPNITNGGIHITRGAGNDITLKDFTASGNGGFGDHGGNHVSIEGGHNNLLISQFSSLNPSSDFIRAFYDTGPDNDPNGCRIEHGIMVRNASWGTRQDHGFIPFGQPGSQGPSAMSGADGNNLNVQRNFVTHNCRIHNGSGQQGGMGIEWWGHESAGTASGRGGIVQYCDLRGGQDHLCSMVRSRDNWIHHNRFFLRDGAYSAYEAGGPNHDGGFFEDNEVISVTPISGAGIYHNSSAHDMSIIYNLFNGTAWILDGSANGGGYVIEHNKMAGGSTGIVSGGGFAIPNIINDNGAGAPGPRP